LSGIAASATRCATEGASKCCGVIRWRGATMRRWIFQQATLLTLCQLDVLDIAMSDGDSSRIRSIMVEG
jgi:hypothetical protein